MMKPFMVRRLVRIVRVSKGSRSGPFGQGRVVVVRDQTADRDTSLHIQQRKYGIEHHATDAFKIDVNATVTRSGQLSRKILGAVINAGVKAKFVRDVVAFFLPSGDAYRAASAESSDLSHDRTNSSTGSRNDYRFARFRLSDIKQSLYAVKPGMPSTPRASDGCGISGSSFVSPMPSETA